MHLDRPGLYIAILGPDGDMAKLTRWAEPDRWGGAGELYHPIARPANDWSDACPT